MTTIPRKPRRTFGWAGKEPFDPRDMHYSVSNAVLEALPPAVNLSSKIKTPAFDQGAIGSCGPQSAAREILFDQEQNPLTDVVPSRLQIYWHTRFLMGSTNQDSGVFNRELCKALARYGWADERLWPYVPSKFRQKPPENVIADAATRKVTRYERVAQTLDMMRGAIAQGDPFIVGFNWYRSWESQSVVSSGDLPLTHPGDQIIGGHDVVMVGYDDTTQRFTFLNSWGTSWGRNGFGTVPYAQWLDPAKASDFWTLHWDEVVPIPDPPIPDPPLPPIPDPPLPPLPIPPDVTITIRGKTYFAKEIIV